jgi:cobalamin biosynthesis protein CobD/CbiB
MGLIALIAALCIEQYRPAGAQNRFYAWFARYANILERHFNAGASQHGIIAWLLAVLPPLIAAGAVYYFLQRIHPVLGWLWNVAVLYLTMGFRQFSHTFTLIHKALRAGDLDRARELLGLWRGSSAAEFSTNEIVRVVIEEGLVCSHRYVFGVIFWFMLLPGPMGAVLYRLVATLSQKWGQPENPEFAKFGRCAERTFELLDWLPVRLTAAGFAVVGDFEDAVYCWRAQAQSWLRPEFGIILASGAGALGVRLGDALHQYGELHPRPELGVGDEADVEHLQSTIGLVWRALVLWLLVLLLLNLASWVG